MTNHIKNSIEQIILKGGFVNKLLEKYINELSNLRHPSSIEREVKEALFAIEKAKGQIHPSNKQTIHNAIEKVWSSYPKGEKELYHTGSTIQIENGVKVTKTITN